ncbi:MAG: helix-turn-helix transcriptional regulator [Clostridia bacterium]|nr:helix-turn-helix transcriptional regulator [Clostridia bacterium]
MEERINNNAAETANTAAAAETANTAETARVDRVIEAEEAFRDAAKIFSVAELFRLFGDPTRVGIMTVLYEKERCVCELSDLLGMTVSAISHQLRLLKQSGLVKYRREGKHLYYSLADSHVSTILAQGFEHVNE